MERVILHSDLNGYFAAVEILHQPALAGKPVVVSGSVEERHGVVLAKSEAAKRAGVKTGMALWQARQCCPNLIAVKPHFDLYIHYSKLVQQIYYRYTDQVEPFGIDECWLDVTNSRRLFGNGTQIAECIRKAVKNEIGLTVSIGVSYNKVFAKLGSDLKKPDAITVITASDFQRKLWPLPVSALLFVGRSTGRQLEKYGVSTIGELARVQPQYLTQWFGKNGITLWKYANGRDDSPVSTFGTHPPAKSMSHGITCAADLTDNTQVRRVLLELAQSVSRRMRQSGSAALGVQVSVRDNALNWRQFQAPLPRPVQSWHILADTAFALFSARYDWQRPVRALSIAAVHLSAGNAPRQLGFFWDEPQYDKYDRLESAIDSIRDRYGKNAVRLAGRLCMNKLPLDRMDEQFVLPNALSRS